MNLDITRMKPEERTYAYSQSMQLESQTGCIGHLRGDFGSGQEFYTTWNDHRAEYKTDDFKAEFDEVVNALRAEDGCGLFASRSAMSKFCYQHREAGFAGRYCTEYGFKLKTAQYTYMLRCNLNQGDYNFYLYAYVSRFLEHHMERAKQGIRFITPDYKEIFRIPDDDKIRILRSDGMHSDHFCRYIDESHVEIGNSLYHICQFAEQIERCGSTVIPLRSSLPEQCFSVLPSTGELVLLTKGERGYTPCYDFSTADRQQNLMFMDDRNTKNNVSKAQAAAMLGGSMFGWATPAADPKSYDEQGRWSPVATDQRRPSRQARTPIKAKRRDRGAER